MTIGKGQAVYDELAKAIQEEWEAIEQEKIDALIKSIDNRVNAVLHAKDWQTRY